MQVLFFSEHSKSIFLAFSLPFDHTLRRVPFCSLSPAHYAHTCPAASWQEGHRVSHRIISNPATTNLTHSVMELTVVHMYWFERLHHDDFLNHDMLQYQYAVFWQENADVGSKRDLGRVTRHPYSADIPEISIQHIETCPVWMSRCSLPWAVLFLTDGQDLRLSRTSIFFHWVLQEHSVHSICVCLVFPRLVQSTVALGKGNSKLKKNSPGSRRNGASKAIWMVNRVFAIPLLKVLNP